MDPSTKPNVLEELSALRQRAAQGDRQAAVAAYHLRREIHARARLSTMRQRAEIQAEADANGETWMETFERRYFSRPRDPAAIPPPPTTADKLITYTLVALFILIILLLIHAGIGTLPANPEGY